MVEVANFFTIGKQHAIAKPIKSVSQDDFALCSLGRTIDSVFGNHFVAYSQVDLALVRVGESVWLPKRHVSIIAGK